MMRGAVLLLTLLIGAFASAADKPQTIEQLRAAADAAEGEHCTKICMEAAQRLVEDSDHYFTSGDVTQGHTSMDDAVKYARKATDASVASRKRQKNTEITLRKLAKRMTDIKETLNVDDKPDVQKNVDDIEQMRSALLEAMFGAIKKDKK